MSGSKRKTLEIDKLHVFLCCCSNTSGEICLFFLTSKISCPAFFSFSARKREYLLKKPEISVQVPFCTSVCSPWTDIRDAGIPNHKLQCNFQGDRKKIYWNSTACARSTNLCSFLHCLTRSLICFCLIINIDVFGHQESDTQELQLQSQNCIFISSKHRVGNTRLCFLCDTSNAQSTCNTTLFGIYRELFQKKIYIKCESCTLIRKKQNKMHLLSVCLR